MSAFAALGGSLAFQKRQRSAPGLRIIAAILAFSLIALPADRALAYPSDGALPSIGTQLMPLTRLWYRAVSPQKTRL